MRKTDDLENRRGQRGGAMVEFALVLPLLFLMSMGGTDFGRLFYHAVTVANAAATGAFYGGQSRIAAANESAQEQRAIDDAVNIDGVTASASGFCECPGDPPAPISCLQAANYNACDGYGLPRVYVRVNALKNFQTIGTYPGVPDNTAVRRDAFIRIQ